MILYHPQLEDLHSYCVPLMEPREIGKTAPGYKVIATAIPLQIAGYRFLVTAAHVAELAFQTHLLISESDTQMKAFRGRVYRTNPELQTADSPASNLDIAILSLGGINIHPSYRFVGEGQLHTDATINGGIECIASGYRTGSNKTIRNSIEIHLNQEAFRFTTVEPEKYTHAKLDPLFHLAVEHPRDVARLDLRKGGIQKARLPNLKGLSGGPMWIKTANGYAISAVTTYHRPDKRLVFGTKISHALEMIDTFLRDFSEP